MKTFIYLICSLWLNFAVHAAELKFEPATPMVAVNQQITLAVSGTSGEVTWACLRGVIQGIGNQVTYTASGEIASDVVTVTDIVILNHL